MISEKFNTETVAVYDHTIRKRKTEEMPQIKDGTEPLLPFQVSAFISLPLSSMELRKGCAVDSMSSVEPPLAGSAMFGDRSLGRL